MDKLVIIDGNNIIHRGFHRFKEMDLKTSTGFPTTAIFGYRNILRRMIREHDTDYMVVCFDFPALTHRHEVYPDYKGGRKKEHKLREQYTYIHSITSLMGVPYYMEKGYEADDIISTLVKRFRNNFDRIVIESTDKDLHQLLYPGVVQITLNEEIDAERLESKLGIYPEDVNLYIALIGDSPGKGDNIPGCGGIGKRSAEILCEYGDLRELETAMDKGDVPSKLCRKLRADWDNVVLSHRLVELVDVPNIRNLEVENLKRGTGNIGGLLEIYEQLEFKG